MSLDSSKHPAKRTTALPAAAGVALLVLVPLVGLTTAIVNRPADPFTGASPSIFELVTSSGVAGLLFNSVALSVVVAVMAVLVGGWLAWVEHRVRFPGIRWMTIATLLPMAMPSYILAGTMRSAMGPGGWIGAPLGLSPPTGFVVAAVVLTVVTAPLVQLIVGASLSRTSAAEEEAARSLGATPLQAFFAVVLPRLRPALGFSGLIALLYAISDFGAVAVLDCPVLTWRLYDAVMGQELARAAILGMAVLGATLPLFLAARHLRGGALPVGVANRRPAPLTRLRKRILLPTFAAFALMVGLGVIIPVSTLCLWVWDGIQRDLPFISPWESLGHTVIAALGGTLLTLALAWLPAKVVAQRQREGRRRSTALLEEATYLTSALPGVLLAMGLMEAALLLAGIGGPRMYHMLLSSGVLLLAGYATRFLAEVFAPLKTGFLLLDPRQEESARVLGVGRWTLFHRVTVPTLAPSVAVAFLIGFNAIVKELPVTLLLGGATGLKTLSFRVWDRYEESLWHDAGVAGLLIVMVAMASVLLTLSWRHDD